jgi:hypothetical protein
LADVVEHFQVESAPSPLRQAAWADFEPEVVDVVEHPAPT